MLLAPQAAGASSPAAGGPVDLATDPALRIDGAAGGGFAGNQVAAGDVNGDGLGDVIVETATGTQYVVFGAPGAGDVDLASLGARGFRIFSSDYRYVLATAIGGVPDSSVAGVGDVNGDGYDDIAVTYGYRPSGGPFTEQGAFVVFGHPGSAQVDVAALGSGGYRIRTDSAADIVSVGGGHDVNGDGLDDVVVGRPLFDTHCGSCAITFAGGDAFVVYGKASSSAIDLGALGSAGFRVRSGGDNELLGQTVDLVGDMNGDGLAEVVLAAPEAGGGFVVFAQPPGSTVTTTSLGSAGFRFIGNAGVCNGDGWYVADAGDVNDDGVPDVLFGTRDQCPGGGFSQGEARIVYGKADTATVSEATDFAAGKGVRIHGLGFCGCPIPDHLSSLVRVGGAGDINGDGVDDVVLGAYAGNGVRFSGVAYVVYGGPALPADIDLSALGAAGFRVDGAAFVDQAGSAVGGVGDFDGDGHPDVAIGAQSADRNGRTDSGTVYVVRGFAPPADLSITKTATVSEAHVGDTFLYTLRAHNDGPGVANGVHAIDHLPAGITFVSSGTELPPQRGRRRLRLPQPRPRRVRAAELRRPGHVGARVGPGARPLARSRARRAVRLARRRREPHAHAVLPAGRRDHDRRERADRERRPGHRDPGVGARPRGPQHRHRQLRARAAQRRDGARAGEGVRAVRRRAVRPTRGPQPCARRIGAVSQTLSGGGGTSPAA